MNVTRLLLLSLTVATTAAYSQDLRSCRAVADAAARLACYDGLSLPAGAAAPSANNSSCPARLVAQLFHIWIIRISQFSKSQISDNSGRYRPAGQVAGASPLGQ